MRFSVVVAFIGVMLICCGNVCSQQASAVTNLKRLIHTDADSARTIIDSIIFNHRDNTGLDRLSELYQLSAKMYSSAARYNLALKDINQAYNIHLTIKDSVNQAEDRFIRCEILWNSGLADDAERRLIKLNEFQKQIDDKERIETLFMLASVYHTRGKYLKGIDLLDSIEKEFYNGMKSSKRAGFLNLKGIFCIKLERYDEAEDYFNKALIINRQLNEDINVGINYNNLGKVAFKRRNYEKALGLYKKAYDIDNRSGNISGLMTKAVNIAAAYYRLGNYKEYNAITKTNLRRALDSKNMRVLKTIYYNEGLYFEEKSSLDSALIMYNKVKDIAKETDDKEGLMLIYNKLAKIYSYRGEYKYAYWSKLKYDANRDSFEKDKGVEERNASELRYELLKSESDSRILEAKLKGSEFELKLVKRNRLIISLVVLLLLLLAIVVILLYRKRYFRAVTDSRSKSGKLDKSSEIIEIKDSVIENYSKRLKYTKEELDQLTYILVNIKDTINSTFNIIRRIRAGEQIKDKQLSVVEIELYDSITFLDESHVIKYSLKKQDSDLRARLLNEFPDLTRNEQELCIMLNLGFSVKEISGRNNTTTKSVEVARYRLRKKLGFDDNDSFLDKIKSV
jgi:tetratricopeptide (TPR) repeat protein